MRIALSLLLGLVLSFTSQAGQPNVILLVADDVGWGDLSCNGNRDVKTPHLDALAESGLRFEKFYSCPNGSTTSASLLTGRYHYRTGVSGERGSEAIMYGNEETLAELYRANGYNTALIGRWHHGENWPHNPLAQGYDHFESDDTLENIISYLNLQTPETPFFCQVNFSASSESEIQKVYEEISTLDHNIGQIVETTYIKKKLHNTIFVFLSDNGPNFFGKQKGRYNGHFYGGKGSVHEGGVRVPCFVSWPEKIKPGSRFTRIATHIDLFPTLRELCGLIETKDKRFAIDGSSLASVLLDPEKTEDWPNRLLCTSWTPPGFNTKDASLAVRTDRWLALRDARWRRHETVVEEQSGWELYDLKTDPFQNHDKGAEFPFLLAELKADLGFWLDHTTDDGLGPIPIHIGHKEWPNIVLSTNTEKRWPVKIIKPGIYLCEARYQNRSAETCELLIDNLRTKLSKKQSKITLNSDTTEIQVIGEGVTSLVIQSFEK